MSAPTKTDIKAVCAECAGVMNITSVERFPGESRMMEHSFTCETCLATASFKFPKSVSEKANVSGKAQAEKVQA
jgi:hypothetical protein